MKIFQKSVVVLSLLLTGGVLAQESLSMAQVREELIAHFEQTKKKGAGVAIGGATVGTLGMIMGTTRIVKAVKLADSYEEIGNNHYIFDGKDYYVKKEVEDEMRKRVGGTVGKSIAWYFTGTMGFTAMAVALPIMNTGKIKSEYWKNKLPATAYVTPNGMEFVWEF
jgi:hypothetical protein